MTATTDLPSILASIQSARLTLQSLTRTITSQPTPAESTAHSDISESVSTYPAALQLDLSNYKELFSQLRFSYLEQVTKEKFLTAITADPPTIIETRQNEEFEEVLRGAKAKLKESKQAVEVILEELERVAERLATAYDQLQKDEEKARRLPKETEEMRRRIDEMMDQRDKRPEMNMPLEDTLEHIDAAESELRKLETELESLEAGLPRKKQRVENLDREIAGNEKAKEGLEKLSSEAVKAREGARAAGKADRENTGQWYKSSYEVLLGLTS